MERGCWPASLWFALATKHIRKFHGTASSLTFFHPRSYSLQICHLQSMLSLRFKTCLTRYIHNLYLSSVPYLRYCCILLHGIDQYITADVDAWAESIAGT
ncbi:uncharacterized protein BJ212DRAFT_1373025 [Suillus subaureus]|uniref:ABC transmembrane type-1 domain-containing protein n=1 Tax=Suillus subaureus TaxID=48587 RepID=A0A9P7JAX7_9AGAM|nr:uncharacterized protein BJ212DRAFT_1373025 [Suillus subaureus]KAG1811774.1 hypothetical protein BJ212DRAFT_1373025 [Suillus subaureus]